MLRVVFIATLLLGLTACSSSPEWKGIYSTGDAKDFSKLDVPPDLSQPDISDNLALPNIAADGSTYSAFSNTDYQGDKVTPASLQGVKVLRDGEYQWLEINASAETLWSDLMVFFTELGFDIKREDKKLGVMETNWLENRASLSTNWFTRTLNKIVSSGLQDKYRARLEKTRDPNITRLFITHRGLIEKGEADSGGNTIQLYWETRPSDPELEAEMYQRFLIYRGGEKGATKKLVTNAKAAERSHIIEKDGMKVLQVNEGFARTWRRVGIALDRIGLLVDDRNRSGGLFYLQISDEFREKIKGDKGWFASLFSGDEVKLKDRYLLRVDDKDTQTFISIYETTGAKADERFVSQLFKDLKTYLD